MKNLIKILTLNLLGICLLASWWLPEQHGFWFTVDKSIFYFFNHLLVESKPFMYLVALTNLRAFDVVAFLFMLLIFYGIYKKQDDKGRRWMFCMGIAMLVSAVIAKQFDSSLPITRPSPTNFFPDVNLVSVLSGWSCKDRSGDSFPGDHGMMLLIFSCYMLKYFGWRVFAKCMAVFVGFSLPRIMAGAHWFTDVAVGSVSCVLIVLSWILLTPLADMFINFIYRIRR